MLQYLEWREKQYDQRAEVAFFTAGDDSRPRVSKAITFIATSNTQSNPQYLGHAKPEDIAKQISTAHGQSGDNCDYVYAMAEAYVEVGILRRVPYAVHCLPHASRSHHLCPAIHYWPNIVLNSAD